MASPLHTYDEDQKRPASPSELEREAHKIYVAAGSPSLPASPDEVELLITAGRSLDPVSTSTFEGNISPFVLAGHSTQPGTWCDSPVVSPVGSPTDSLHYHRIPTWSFQCEEDSTQIYDLTEATKVRFCKFSK
jgi:hypothetical protein